MCGIIGAFNFDENKENVNDWIIDQLEDQISRGKDGFGIIFIDSKKNIIIKRATEISKSMVDLYMTKCKMIILHHRTPTSSQNKISQTHPILVKNGSLKHDYLVIHNGIISNCDQLKETHEAMGFLYTTERMKDKGFTYEKEEYNDSEALAIEIARFIEGQEDVVDTRGNAAFIALQIDKKTDKAKKVYFGRNDGFNPIHLSSAQGKIRLSSEGEGNNCKEETLYQFNLNDFKLHKNKLLFTKLPETSTGFIGSRDYHLGGKDYGNQNYPYEYEPLNDGIELATDDNKKEAVTLVEDFFELISTEEHVATIDDEYIRSIGGDILRQLKEGVENGMHAYQTLAMEAEEDRLEEEAEERRKDAEKEKENEPETKLEDVIEVNTTNTTIENKKVKKALVKT